MRYGFWSMIFLLMCCTAAGAQSLDRPTRVTADTAGNIYVSEQPVGFTVGPVVVITPSGTVTRRIQSTGSSIVDPGYFSSIRDLAIAPNGEIYLLDAVQHRILRMSPSGSPMGAIPLPATAKISAFLLLPNGNILLANASNGSVLTLDPAGQVLGTVPVFDLPVPADESFDIALDGSSYLLVTDPTHHRVIKFDWRGASPRWVGWLGGCTTGSQCSKAPGSTIGHTQGFCNGTTAQCGAPVAARIPGGFERPSFIAADPAGSWYVTDLVQGVQLFNAAAVPQGPLPRGRDVGQTGGGHVFVASNGDLYIADTGNNRVNRFSRSGALVAVLGGGMDLSIVPGDTDLNRISLTEQAPTQSAVVMASSLGYTGPATLVATSCLRETASPPYVSCASYGLSTTLSKTSLSLTAGTSDTASIMVSATTAVPGRTLNGRYLVAVSALDPSGRILVTGQAAINVMLADKFGIVAIPGQLTMFPGDSSSIQLQLTNLSGVAGSVTLDTGVAPMQAAGHLSHTLTPRSVTTTRGTTVPDMPVLQLRLSETARSGNPNINVFAKRGTTQIGSATIDLQIDCFCRDTGAFVEPDVLAVTPSATNPLTGTSPSGTYTVNAGIVPNTTPAVPFVEVQGRVSQVPNAAAWGFSPNEKYFLVATGNPSIPNQTYLAVYDLSVRDKIVQSITIMGCAPGNAACTPPPSFCFGGASCLSPKGTKPSLTIGHAGWGFSPDDNTLLVAQLDVAVFPTRSYSLTAYDLSRPYSAPMLNQSFTGGNAFWRFSPCGDMLMHFEQRAVGSAIERDARFWALNGRLTPASRLLATAVYTGTGTGPASAPSARVVNASSIPTGSHGDFDVALTNLSALGSPRTDGFQSLQCRAR